MSNADFQSYLDDLRKKNATATSANMLFNTDDAALTAESLQIGKEFGVPPEVIKGSPDYFRQEYQIRKTAGTLQSAPKLANWLKDDINRSLAKDDVDNLARVEGLAWIGDGLLALAGETDKTSLVRGARAGGEGVGMIATGVRAMPAQAAVQTAMDRLSLYDRAQSLSPDATTFDIAQALGVAQDSVDATLVQHFLSGDEGVRKGMIAQAADRLASNEEVISALQSSINAYVSEIQAQKGEIPDFSSIDGAKGFADWFAFNTGQALPYLAVLATIGTLTGGTGVVGGGYLMGVGDVNAQLISEGVTDRPDIAAVAGVPYAALERLGPVGSVFRGVKKDILEEVARGYFKRLGREVPQQFVEEFINEAGQEIISDYATSVGTGEDFIIDDAALVRWFDAGMAGGASAVAVSPVTTGAKQTASQAALEGNLRRVAQSGQTASALERVDEIAANSTLRSRAPEKFGEVIGKMSDDAEIFVPADQMREYFQAKDLALDDAMLEAWGVDPADFEAKVQSGGLIALPVAQYAEKFAGTDDAAWFHDNATNDPDGMSRADARAFNEAWKDEIAKIQEEMAARDEGDRAARASDIQIYDQMLSDLRAAGRSPDVAQNEATVWTAFWRTMGERYGEDPLDLARSMGVRVQGPMTDEAFRKRGALDIQINTLRSQGDKALRARGPSLIEFIKSEGGIRDTGGDVEAMDAPKGVIAETRAQEQERRSQATLGGLPSEGRGIGLDEMGRKAIEAGYFPELLGGTEQADGTIVDEAAALLQAIQEEIAGRPIYRIGDEPDADLVGLAEALSERGIDISTATNDDIAAALDDAGDGAMYNQDGIDQQPLYVVHNLSAENLKHAVDLGGLAAPSLAIARGDVGFDNFGEISLIGSPSMADPRARGVKAFNADVYSPRQPRAQYDINSKEYRAMLDALDGAAVKLQESIRGNLDPERISREGLSVLERNDVVRMAFLMDIGDAPRVVYKKEEAYPKSFKKWVGKPYYETVNDPAFVVAVKSDIMAKLEGLDSEIIAARMDRFLPDGNPRRTVLEQRARILQDAKGPKKVDGYEMYSAIAKKMRKSKKREDQFRSWIEEKFGEVLGAKFFENASGRRKRYEIDELVRDMTRTLRDGEGWNYGVGSVRSTVAHQFRSMAEIKAKRGSITGEEAMQSLKDEATDEMIALADKFAPLHSSGQDFGWLDIFSEFLKDLGKGRVREWQRSIFDRPASDDLLDQARAFIDKLRDMPTEYFEIKMQRAVSLDEFFAAVAPRKASKETMQHLRNAGLKVVRYDRDKPESRIEAVQSLGARIFFQEKRGSIQFPASGIEAGETVINLFDGADLSTVLHESTHFYLEAFTALATKEDAPESMKADLEAIRAFIGNTGEAYTVEQHEKFARAGEAYFMEGKAPSMLLADAFSRFRAWLMRIYQTAVRLNVKLTPEVRSVFDRMFATDEEIQFQRDQTSQRPLFADPTEFGMSAVEAKAYQRLAQRAVSEAERSLLKRATEKVRREKEAWYRKERKAVREEVEASFAKKPVYRLIELLANQRWIGADTDGVNDMRMDKAALIDIFGEGVIAELSRNRIGGKRAIYTNDGMDPHVVAEFFGFSGVTEMVEVIQNAPRFKDAVASETDRIMDERHGDPLNDGSIEEEALEAIHGDQQAELVATEARQLGKQAGRDVSGLNKRIFAYRAKMMLSQMSVSEASKPQAFLTAERKAGRAAEAALAKVVKGGKDAERHLGDAFEAKQRQLLNQMLWRESRDFSALMDRKREQMQKYSKKSVREKLEGGYIEQIDAILEAYDFRKRSNKAVSRDESLHDFIQRMTDEGRESELAIDPSLVDWVNRRHYTRLKVEEIRGIFDAIDNLDHMGRFKMKLIEKGKKRDLLESAKTVAEQIKTNIGTGKAKGETFIRSTFNLIFTTDTILNDIDGTDEFGPAYREIKEAIDAGQVEEQRMSVELAEKLDDLFSVYTKAELRDMQVKREVRGERRTWSKLDAIAIALNTGNADNLQRLLAEDAHPDVRLTRNELDAILATLDKRDWGFVQSSWDLINGYWPQIAEVTERRTGVKPEKVAAMPFENAHGKFDGGYYPIKYDPGLSQNAALDAKSAFDRFISAGRHSKAQTKNGHTIERKKTGNGRSLLLDVGVMFTHLRDVVRDIALSEAVDSAYRVINHPVVHEAFIDAGRANDHNVLNLWLKDVAQGPLYNSDVLNRLSRMTKNNFTLSRLAFNLKTVALQATGLGQAAATVGKKHMLKALVDYRGRFWDLPNEIMEKSPFMRERQSTFQKDIYDFANDVKVATPIRGRWGRSKDFIAKLGFAPIVKMQFYVVDVPTWIAGFNAGLERFHDEARAIQYADRMVARSQDSAFMGDRAAVSRGTLSETTRQSDFVRLFTTLQGYMITKLNRSHITIARGRKGMTEGTIPSRVGAAANMATDLMLLYVFEAAMLALMYSLMTDEEEPEDVRDYMLKEIGAAAFGGIPLVRDAYGAFGGFGGGGVYGSVMEVPANIAVQVKQLENDRALRRAIGDAVGLTTGLPSTATLRVIEGFMGDDDTSPAEMFFGTNPLTR